MLEKIFNIIFNKKNKIKLFQFGFVYDLILKKELHHHFLQQKYLL
jgi:hypothetical protein